MKKSRFTPVKSEGTYFQLFDYSGISDMPDVEFAKWLVEKHKVATIPISPFCTKLNNDRVVRMCFAKTDDILSKAAIRLCKV